MRVYESDALEVDALVWTGRTARPSSPHSALEIARLDIRSVRIGSLAEFNPAHGT
jgi:hypothetical protein